ncbi:acyl carrier protein [Saccharopolyspora hattusasensis]|uniref:acyl carrier protein n=1 Tax=Saccharopolyspora hattusasensis TaxID=1128679 RepID=UPI003D99B1BA
MTATPPANGISVRQTVLEIITTLRPHHDGITEATPLAELGLDSLDRLALAIRIEQTIGVVLTGPVLPGLRSIADVIDTVTNGAPQ